MLTTTFTDKDRVKVFYKEKF